MVSHNCDPRFVGRNTFVKNGCVRNGLSGYAAIVGFRPRPNEKAHNVASASILALPYSQLERSYTVGRFDATHEMLAWIVFRFLFFCCVGISKIIRT